METVHDKTYRIKERIRSTKKVKKATTFLLLCCVI